MAKLNEIHTTIINGDFRCNKCGDKILAGEPIYSIGVFACVKCTEKSLNKKTLSILIPARNEEFLQKTIDDVLSKIEGDTEILVALDNWENPPTIKSNPRVGIVITRDGQRGATNILANLSRSKYLMKLDAHCSMSKGFDVAMMEDMQDDLLLVPAICNLWAYDWVCPKGHRHFQGKYDECEQCGDKSLTKEIVWQIIPKPCRSNFGFDSRLHFQYMPKDTDELLSETMSIQGSCFMVSREKYHELNICDEAFGSWGQQGVETACKMWLSGGRVMSTKKAYYGHQFRETEGFPYLNKAEDIFKAQDFSRNLFLNNKWDKQIHSFQWLIEKFNYPRFEIKDHPEYDWTHEKLEEMCKPFIKDVV